VLACTGFRVALPTFALQHLRCALLEGMPTNIPQLYIYSTADKLISANAVESFISRQKANGVKVTAKRFTDTPHVQHYLRKEVEYKQALQSFVGQL